jgi:hypothetical protein
VISSSNQTNGRPAAHRVRYVVFQCRPGRISSSMSGPVDDGQVRQADAGRDDLVRLGHPRRRPDKLAPELQESPAVPRVKPVHQRVTVLGLRLGTGTGVAARPGRERDQRAVHIKEYQRRVAVNGLHRPKVQPAAHRVGGPDEHAGTWRAQGCGILPARWGRPTPSTVVQMP